MLIGIDYASIDGNAAPDLATLKSACIASRSQLSVAVLRGAWGTMPDAMIRRDWARLVDAGLTCGAYLFLRMPQLNFNATPEDQVHAFADNVGKLTDRNLVPILDVEDSVMGDPLTELSWVHRAWLELVAVYGAAPMIYTSDRVWHEDLHDLPAGEMVASPLWLAKPWPWRVRTPAQLSGSTFDSGRFDPPVPKPWGAGDWWMHQYQGDAFPMPGFSGTVDLSRFRVMRAGETGPRVAWAKRKLGLAPKDGTFDSAMLKAVRGFQLDRGLVADGVIGPRTFAALSWWLDHPLAA